MSSQIFVRREKADAPGEFEYVEVSADTVDPEVIRPLVVGHPDYRKVVAESIERKEKIRALTADKSNEEAAAQTGSNPPPPPAQPVSIDEDALLEKLLAKQTAIADAQRRAAEDRAAQINGLVAEFKLNPSAVALLQQAANPRDMAQTLATGRYSFGDAPAGGNPKGDTADELEDLQARVFKKLNI